MTSLCMMNIHPRKRKSKPKENLFRDFFRLAGCWPNQVMGGGENMMFNPWLEGKHRIG